MRINEIEYSGQLPVDSYGPGFFRVDGNIHEGAMILGALGVSAWDAVTLPVGLLEGIDIVLVGTGADIARLPGELLEALEAAGFGYETMATPAACRTYNMLLAEGRRVALAALAV